MKLYHILTALNEDGVYHRRLLRTDWDEVNIGGRIFVEGEVSWLYGADNKGKELWTSFRKGGVPADEISLYVELDDQDPAADFNSHGQTPSLVIQKLPLENVAQLTPP